MNQNDFRTYEAAFTLCLGEKEKGMDTIDAINKIVKMMGSLVSDADDLREYLYKQGQKSGVRKPLKKASMNQLTS